jgi:hypothetical protein
MVKDGYFSYTWHHFTSLGEHPHLFDLALILFYLEVVMDGFLGGCVALGGPHMWLVHACTWSPFYIWSFFLEGAHVETFPLAIFGGFILEEHTIILFYLHA